MITDFQAKMATARGEMEETSKKGGSSFASMGKASGMALAAVGVAAAAVGVVAVKMGSTLEDSQRRLAVAVTDSGHKMSDFAGPLATADKQMEKFGFTNAQANDALAIMTTGLGSPTKAVAALGTAADLAAFKHVDLSTAALAVTKAMEGNQRPLKQLGIDLPIVASSAVKVAAAQATLAKDQAAVNAILAKTPDAVNAGSKAHAGYETAIGKVSAAQAKLSALQSAGGGIMDALNQKIGGQAADAASTFAGKLQVAKATGEDLLATLGVKLIPVLERVMSTIMGVVTWLEKHSTVAKALGIVIGVLLVGAIVLWTASMVAAAIATIAATWPIILIIAAVALLVAGIVLLITHWRQVWAEVGKLAGDAWHFIDSNFVQPVQRFFSSIANFIKTHWQLILAILTGPIGLAVLFISRNVDSIVGFFTAIPGRISGAASTMWAGITWAFATTVNWFSHRVDDVVGFFTSMPGRIAGAAMGMWDGISGAFRSAINTIIGWWDDFVGYLRIPGFTIGVGPVSYHFGGLDFGAGLQIPYLEKGGLVTASGLIFAHAGEAITPAPSGFGGGQTSGSTVNVYVNGPVLNWDETAKALAEPVRRAINQGIARNGTRTFIR